ncbi:serine protease snake-like isoform X2 [Pieris brassicae]|uniref:serine protease snake-like isoform X2 n=1 Tax=Pieris brassicae TaxID=7116 RepID=UPI001E65E3C2|nr:serine protease snake-like isoform X2 [Pieris brassicae]
MKILIILTLFEVSVMYVTGFQILNTSLGQITRKARADESEDPCNYTAPPKPDFSASGRRISEAMCYEFIWEIKKREDDSKSTIKCWQKEYPYIPPIVGGVLTSPGEFPHMGAVGWKAAVGTWIFKCGSTLISSKFLLTAAHCSKVSPHDTSVANVEPEIVRLGDKNIADVFSKGVFPQDVKINRIVKHPNYSAPKKYFDIAIIEVTTEVIFTKLVQPACLWTNHDTSQLGTKATLTGWGVIESGGREATPELQAADVDIIDSDECQSLLRYYFNRLWWGVDLNQLCAGKFAGGVDACQGDSGGPLQVKIPLPITSQGSIHYVIGITSFGIGCAQPNIPGIYTRVSSFIDWIEDVVWIRSTVYHHG